MSDTPIQQKPDTPEVRPNVRLSDEMAKGSSVWLVSFTDVIALMLTFFVLLYSMTSPDIEKWENKLGMPLDAVAQYSGPPQNAGANEGININRIDYNAGEDIEYIEALLVESLTNSGQADDIVVQSMGGDVQVTIMNQDKVNFDSVLRQLSPTFNNLNNQIKITSSMTNRNTNEMFKRMQLAGEVLMQSGYKKPIAIGMTGAGQDGYTGYIHILIQPHDGRRIIR